VTAVEAADAIRVWRSRASTERERDDNALARRRADAFERIADELESKFPNALRAAMACEEEE
jgi:hypothetical protein